jgi:hypothetical protein
LQQGPKLPDILHIFKTESFLDEGIARCRAAVAPSRTLAFHRRGLNGKRQGIKVRVSVSG